MSNILSCIVLFCRSGRPVLLGLCAMLSLAFPSYAQTPEPAPDSALPQVRSIAGIVLTEQTERATLGNNFYVVPDKNQIYSARQVAEEVASGTMSSHLARNGLLRLGVESSLYWIVLPITNRSNNELWELDFGNEANGRHALLGKLVVTNFINNVVSYDSNRTNEGIVLIEHKLRLGIPSRQSGFVVLEIRTVPGRPNVFPLSLQKSPSLESRFSPGGLVNNYLPLATTLILLTAFALRRDLSFLSLAGGWALITVYTLLLDNFIYLGFSTAPLLIPSLWLMVSLTLLAGFYLAEDIRREVPLSLFIGTGFLCLALGLSGLLVGNFMPKIGLVFSTGPMLLTALVLMTLSWSIGWRKINRIYYLQSFCGALYLCGFSVFLLVAFDFIPPEKTLTVLRWFSISISANGLMLSLYTLLGHTPSQASQTQGLYEPENSGLGKDLAAAKEESEHRRLLQILDQERATMGEMQIQEARRTEEMRKAKEAADEANAAKSAFLAVVSHEIRTPMTGVMGMVRLLLETGLSKEQRDYATTIQDSGEALMALLNDILDFEKIESGKLELESIDMDLHRLLRGVQTLMNGHAAAKNVRLELELDPKVPAFVIGDPTRLRQVLLNLVNNAIKFTSKGTVWLRVKDLTPDDRVNGSSRQIYFAVQDSGIGISPEVQRKLFVPFAQADATTSRKYGGTGLGLAICKRLIEAMGDMINISSKPGEGSTFFFTLTMKLGDQQNAGLAAAASSPAAVQNSAAESFAADESKTTRDEIEKKPAMVSLNQPSRFLNILVVEDNGISQKVMRGLIEKQGHRVSVAGSGGDAINAHLAAYFDLILLDIELPDMSGHEVAKKIRTLEDTVKANTPIVAMTGNTSEKDIDACLASGMNDFLAKPIVPENLRAVLKLAASKNGWKGETPLVLADKTVKVDAGFDFSQVLPDSSEARGTVDSDDDEDSFSAAIRQFEEMEARSMASTTENCLDLTIVNSLRSSLNPAQLEDLIQGFYDKTEELIGAIAEAWSRQDLETLRARAHELKGMAGNFGFSRLWSQAGSIEKAARDGEAGSLGDQIERLPETFVMCKIQFDKSGNAT